MKTTIRLPLSAAKVGEEDFERVLKQELKEQAAALPLQQFANEGGLVKTDDLTILASEPETSDDITTINLRVFFTEIVGGCSCGDAPYESNNQAELTLRLNHTNAAADIAAR